MLETVTLKDVYRELREIKQRMVSKEEVQQLLETIEILHNPQTMRQIRASEEDIRAGRTKLVRGMKDLLAELDYYGKWRAPILFLLH